MMRIITGRARGVRLETLPGEATRPTLERTKEAVFSMIQFSVRDARVLDLFAGSGQLGLEALSRGAKHAIFCDRSREAAAIIKKNIEKTRLGDLCEVFCSDFRALPATLREPFDLVFLDPPYAIGAIPEALRLLLSRSLLSDGAIIVCESGAEADVFGGDDALAARFTVAKQARYGAAFVTVLNYLEGK